MATSQAAPAPTAAVVASSGTASTTSQTIVGSHVFKIDGFSATKDLGVGNCITSSTFRVAGHDWYIKCYPCGRGDHEESAGWVTLVLCSQDDDPPAYPALGGCEFTMMDSLENGCLKRLPAHRSKKATLKYNERHSLLGTEFMERRKLESLLKDDSFHVRCDLRILKFPAVTKRDLATGSHVLTIDEYTKIRRALVIRESIKSSKFRVGGHNWYFDFYPCGPYGDNNEGPCVNLFLDNPDSDDEVKVRFEIALLIHGGQIISSTQDFYAFSKRNNEYSCSFLSMMEHETWPHLQDGIHIRCDIAVVDRITAIPILRQCICSDIQESQKVKVRGDVTFEVGGHLFPAHKSILATRCTAFMAEFFAPAGKENAGVTDRVRVDDMEPRVFEALLHFIYTDALPEVRDKDTFVMAQDLLVAADRYGMERLKLICSDILGSYVNDARTAVAMLELADKHGCSKLKEVCMKLLKGHFAIGAP